MCNDKWSDEWVTLSKASVNNWSRSWLHVGVSSEGLMMTVLPGTWIEGVLDGVLDGMGFEGKGRTFKYTIWTFKIRYGHSNTESGLSKIRHGLWNTNSGLSKIRHGLWSTNSGLCKTNFGSQNTKSGSQNTKSGS